MESIEIVNARGSKFFWTSNYKRPRLAVLVGVGRCHQHWMLWERWRFEFAHCQKTERVAKFCSLNLHSQIDGRDEMLGGQWRAVLCGWSGPQRFYGPQ